LEAQAVSGIVGDGKRQGEQQHGMDGGERRRTNPAAASRLGGAGFVLTADYSNDDFGFVKMIR
jgi:hypothetical protein